MLLIHYDQSESGKRQKNRRPYSKHDEWTIGMKKFVPDIDSFGVGELGMVDEQSIAEHLAQTV